jgi:hypothetical protein
MRHKGKCRTRRSGHVIRTDSANWRRTPWQQQVAWRYDEPDFRGCRQIIPKRDTRHQQVDEGICSFDAVTEKSNRTRVIRVGRVGVDGGVKLRANRE